MGIYIKGVGMPENSRMCPFAELAEDWEKVCILGAKYQWHKNRRCDDCPLIPIPPHGRLIDADALEDRCSRQAKDEWNKSTGTNWGYAYAAFESDVEDAPTIIPAEETEK